MTGSLGFLGKVVDVIIDRPFGSKHPTHNFRYEANYGYIPNTIASDGEEIDAYVLGINKPIKKFTGVCIAVIKRIDDDDDKLVVVKKDTNFTDSEIDTATHFQEKWRKHVIVRQLKNKK